MLIKLVLCLLLAILACSIATEEKVPQEQKAAKTKELSGRDGRSLPVSNTRSLTFDNQPLATIDLNALFGQKTTTTKRPRWDSYESSEEDHRPRPTKRRRKKKPTTSRPPPDPCAETNPNRPYWCNRDEICAADAPNRPWWCDPGDPCEGDRPNKPGWCNRENPCEAENVNNRPWWCNRPDPCDRQPADQRPWWCPICNPATGEPPAWCNRGPNWGGGGGGNWPIGGGGFPPFGGYPYYYPYSYPYWWYYWPYRYGWQANDLQEDPVRAVSAGASPFGASSFDPQSLASQPFSVNPGAAMGFPPGAPQIPPFAMPPHMQQMSQMSPMG